MEGVRDHDLQHPDEDDLDHAIRVLSHHGMIAVSPRRSPDQQAQDAVEQIGFELTSLRDAIRAGGKLSDQKRHNLASMAAVMQRIGSAS